MGTRRSLHRDNAVIEDHPHAYGDKTADVPLLSIILGSSPRVWGQVVCITLFLYGLRIIPTRMGTSTRFLQCGKQLQDHPHAYGDKLLFRHF